MLAVGAGTLAAGVDASVTQVVDSISGFDCKHTPILLLPVDGRVTSALRPAVDDSWLSSMSPSGSRRGSSGRQSAAGVEAGRQDHDASYRYRRERNNAAARRSREKRRRQDDVIRGQLEAVAAENRELRCQLTLLRRLLDEVAASGTRAPAHRRDAGGSGGGTLRPGWSISSISTAASSDLSHRDDVIDDSSTDEVTAVGGGESKLEDGCSLSSGKDAAQSSTSSERDEQEMSCDVVESAEEWRQSQLTPLNLSQRVARS